MKKLAQLMKDHINGNKTKESIAFFNRIAEQLEDNGFKPPFEMEVKPYTNKRLDAATRKILNSQLYDLVAPNYKTRYFNEIPLQDIIDILNVQGLNILQEDNTPWDGFLLGDDSSASFSIGILGNIDVPLSPPPPPPTKVIILPPSPPP